MKPNVKKLLILNLPYLFFVWLFMKVGEAYRLEDLYNALKEQPEAEAQRVAAALELYVHGSLNVFNHRTNIDIHNRLVCFDIKELGKQLKKLGMLIIQDVRFVSC